MTKVDEKDGAFAMRFPLFMSRPGKFTGQDHRDRQGRQEVRHLRTAGGHPAGELSLIG